MGVPVRTKMLQVIWAIYENIWCLLRKFLDGYKIFVTGVPLASPYNSLLSY